MAGLRSSLATVADAHAAALPDVEPPCYLEPEAPKVWPSLFPPHNAQRALSRPLWLCHKFSLLQHSQPAERALLRSACALGGHEWTDAVPSHDDFRVPAVLWLPAFRHYLGLPTFPGEHPPLACKCRRGETPPWVHALSCNLGGVATKKHGMLGRA